MGCLNEERVFGLVSGALVSTEVHAARLHLEQCGACRVLVAETAKSVDSSGSVAIEVDLPETLFDDSTAPRAPGAADSLSRGDVIDGKYRIEEAIGRGGMGYVVAAVHLQLGVEVAIKVLHAKMLVRNDVVGRFLREARAAARINSPHVVSVLDVGGLAHGEPFIVMERLRGKDLSAELAERERLGVQEAVDYTVEICEAVAEAHAMGVVHRDLKPANIFLCKKEGTASHVKVLDFGISKISQTGDTGTPDFSTEVQAWLGTPRYMAPEQITLGRRVDERADIWGIGTILYELISGHAPFQEKSLDTLCKKILDEDPPALGSETAETLPRGLDELVARCLAKAPDARYANVGELARALRPYASPSKEEAVLRIAALRGMAADPSVKRDARPRIPGSRPRHRGRYAVMAAVVVAGLGSALFWRGALRATVREPSALSPSVEAASAAPAEIDLALQSPPVAPATSVQPPYDEPASAASAASPARHPAPRVLPQAPKVKHPEFGRRL
jgi:serine/threonine protein kinase